jgi:hypothetical protein
VRRLFSGTECPTLTHLCHVQDGQRYRAVPGADTPRLPIAANSGTASRFSQECAAKPTPKALLMGSARPGQ